MYAIFFISKCFKIELINISQSKNVNEKKPTPILQVSLTFQLYATPFL